MVKDEDGNLEILGALHENEENEKAFARDPSEFISLGVLRIAFGLLKQCGAAYYKFNTVSKIVDMNTI